MVRGRRRRQCELTCHRFLHSTWRSHGEPHRNPAMRRRWAELIRRIYEMDPLLCQNCGQTMAIIAFITERRVIRKILRHLETLAARERRSTPGHPRPVGRLATSPTRPNTSSPHLPAGCPSPARYSRVYTRHAQFVVKTTTPGLPLGDPPPTPIPAVLDPTRPGVASWGAHTASGHRPRQSKFLSIACLHHLGQLRKPQPLDVLPSIGATARIKS